MDLMRSKILAILQSGGSNEGKVQDVLTAQHRVRELEDLLLWVLYHNQGGASYVGQPIRRALGMGAYDVLTAEQIERGKAAALFAVTDNEIARSRRSCVRDGHGYKED